MIVFITDNPAHETDAEIIKTLKNKTNNFLVMSPEINELDLEKIILIDEKALFLIKPNHPNTLNICKILQKYEANTINPIFTTLFFKNKWNIFNSLKILFEDENTPLNIINHFEIPRTWYLKSEPDLNEEEKSEFFKDLKDSFENKFPLIAKHPINHIGYHFVCLISTYEELLKLENLIFTSGLILQEFVGSTAEIIKCYCIGNQIFSFKQKGFMQKFNELSDSIEQLSIENKPSKQNFETPLVIEELIKFLKVKYDIKLFGVDLIEHGKDLYYLVDINDFPGFRGIKNAGELIGELVLKHNQS